MYSVSAMRAHYEADSLCNDIMTFDEYNIWMLDIMAWEVGQLDEPHEVTDEVLDFLNWPLANCEIREFFPDQEIWKHVGDKANRIRQPHLYEPEELMA